MKRTLSAGLAILAVVVSVGWKLAGQSESSAGLQDISLLKSSEHSQPGPSALMSRIAVRVSSDSTVTNAMARIRIRISSDSGYAIRAAADKVPQLAVAAD